jgi:PIN domain nuclease of toxin-antitoxin system
VSSRALDASALLAVTNGEPGAAVVSEMLDPDDEPAISAVNLAEVIAKLVERGWSEREAREAVALPLAIHSFDEELAYATGFLRVSTRSAGLSLGDRACIALGMKLGVPVVTADRSWATLGLPVEVIVIR